MSSSEAAPRSQGLDTLRALAIVLVFVYHYRVFVSRELSLGWASTIGWTGVDLFFVLICEHPAPEYRYHPPSGSSAALGRPGAG